MCSAAPIGRDVLQCQPDQFRRGIVSREVTSCLDDLAQLSIDALDGVSGVDHFSDAWREDEKRDDSISGASPSGYDCWVLLAPRPGFECVQSLLGSFNIKRLVNRLEGGMRRDLMSQSFTTRVDQLWTVYCR